MEFPRIVTSLCVAFLISSIKCDPVKYFMTSYCGSTIYMYTGSILLDLTPFTAYDPNMKCAVTVESDKLYMERVMVKVLWIDVEGTAFCAYDRLMIYDGASTSSPKLTDNYGLCGTKVPHTIYTTTGQSVTFNFTSDASRQKRGFQLLITGFDDSGYCLTNSEYECDNSYCISEYLKCDGYNNCGDNSDEEHCGLTTGTIVGISCGCVGGAFMLAAFVIMLASRRNNHYSRVGGTAAPGLQEGSYLPGVQPYPAYGSPIAGQYPAQTSLPPSYGTLYSSQAVAGQATNPYVQAVPQKN